MLLRETLRSSTFRFALLAIAVFGAVVIIFLGYVDYAASAFVRDAVNQAVESERLALVSQFERSGSDGLDSAIGERIRNSGGVGFYLHADAVGKPIIGNLDEWPTSPIGIGPQGRSGGEPVEVRRPAGISLHATMTTLSDGSHLLVGRSTGELDGFRREMAVAVGLTLAFICLLAGVASIRITGRTVARIESINATSRAIMDRGLNTRIPLRGTNDEWDRLAANLNSMLDRIEMLLAEIKQVSENVAHDLRTPLTRMRGRLEVAYSGIASDRTYRDVIADTLSDLDNVLRMFSSLMRISRIESTEEHSGFDRVDVVAIAHEVAELFEPAAQEAGGWLRVEHAGETHVIGDRDLLFDALSNIVDNAIKYAAGAQIIISVKSAAASVILSVVDNGPGIPSDELPQVWKRFYRVEKWRGTPGHGLGLSLVAAVTRMHRGQVRLLNRSPGLEVRLELPHCLDEP